MEKKKERSSSRSGLTEKVQISIQKKLEDEAMKKEETLKQEALKKEAEAREAA